jgi:hypothetical protein
VDVDWVEVVFTAGDTHDLPVDVEEVFVVEGVAAGGGGAGYWSDSGIHASGGGGGEGSRAEMLLLAVTAGEVLTVAVGTGGAGGTAEISAGAPTSGLNGATGGNLTITGGTSGLLLTLNGGAGGTNIGQTRGFTGGEGGSTTLSGRIFRGQRGNSGVAHTAGNTVNEFVGDSKGGGYTGGTHNGSGVPQVGVQGGGGAGATILYSGSAGGNGAAGGNGVLRLGYWTSSITGKPAAV